MLRTQVATIHKFPDSFFLIRQLCKLLTAGRNNHTFPDYFLYSIALQAAHQTSQPRFPV
jgi:hypothetical protein